MKKLLISLLAFVAVDCFGAIGDGPGGISINFVENAGSTVTQRNKLNFQGSGVSVADNQISSRTDVTINSGGGSSNLAVSQNGVVISSPTAVLNFVGTGASIALTGGATAQITVNAGDVFLASTQTFSGQNFFRSAAPSTFTYLSVSTLTLPNQVNHGVLYMNGPPVSSTSTFTFNGSTLTVAQLSAMGIVVSTIQINSQLLDYSGNPGPIGYVFTSNGSSLPPSWQVTKSSGTGTITTINAGTGISVTNSTGPIVTISATGSGGGASYYFQLLDVSTAGIAINDQPCYNGSLWVMIPIGGSCAFSIASFSDSLASTIEEGVGVWKSSGTINFTASYSNGPPIGSTITFSGWSPLPLASPFTSTTSIANVNFPSVGGTVVFTLTAQKTGTATATITHSFNNDRYWGDSTISTQSYTSADIRGLTGGGNDLTNSIPTTFTVNAGSGQYIVYSYPSRLGTATFTVGGFTGGFDGPFTTSVTNASGFSETYNIYSSHNPNLGSTTVVVTTP
jgi:hypothetical protein